MRKMNKVTGPGGFPDTQHTTLVYSSSPACRGRELVGVTSRTLTRP